MTIAPPPTAESAEPIARVKGQPYVTLPSDLYIPPDALEVLLETFEGPLDLLLYLIKRHNLDILDIPIAEITRQYMDYLELMRHLQLELAADYMVMAAMLAEIKSRMLLPQPSAADGEEPEDPRAELIRRLQAYEQIKRGAEELDLLPRLERDIYPVDVPSQHHRQRPPPAVSLDELLLALREVLYRADLFQQHQIQREPLSVRERMSVLLEQLDAVRFTSFNQLCRPEEGRRGIVVTFLALLELIKETLVELVQAEPFGPIHLRLRS